ncbi:hypothetical protein ELE36_12690 [Pseudolysobacter antarcticus]|uniref:Uncharacterized protein n=1 Tax=Pseudolysobacter antarcticus TaxID=2511995 RepID=A0A411HKW9_9GAMM|nr:hypothetical protein [Pseudolysobacter antarcticus]QBB71141.1 hypothetical protein ELE36_12690 [Pseudolysobacter antarcticus]
MRRQISPDELDSLYCSIGKCVWHLQYVEDALQTLLTLKVDIKAPGGVTEAEAKELLAKHRRATLGTSLRTAEKHNALPMEVMSRLSQFKEERDWLVHKSVNKDGEGLYTSEGRSAIFGRLNAFVDEAMSLQRALGLEVATFIESHGLSVAKVDELGRQKIARLKGNV